MRAAGGLAVRMLFGVAVLLGLAAAFSALGQTTKVYRVGVLTPSASQWQPTVFRQALRDLGYEEPRNLTIAVRDARGRLEALPALAAELARENVDVIVAINTPGTRAAMRATKTIPIVMGVVGDPVATGFVPNLQHPGGNVTGVSNLNREITAKRLQLLKEAVPSADRIAVLLHPDDPITKPQVEDTKAAATQLGIELKFFPVRSPEDLGNSFVLMKEWRAQAILRLAGQALAVSKPTIQMALAHRLPTMMLTKEDVALGALMSYDADREELFRRSAHFVDEILKGAKAGDLAVEQPSRFELVINRGTEKAIGLTIAPSLLMRADHLIEP